VRRRLEQLVELVVQSEDLIFLHLDDLALLEKFLLHQRVLGGGRRLLERISSGSRLGVVLAVQTESGLEVVDLSSRDFELASQVIDLLDECDVLLYTIEHSREADVCSTGIQRCVNYTEEQQVCTHIS